MKKIQIPLPIDQIVSMATANLVLAALLVSLVGATLATGIRHWTGQNWHPHLEDVWYYILSGGIGVSLVLFGYGTGEILAATTGVNTPLALVKTGWDKFSASKNGTALSKASLTEIKAEIVRRGG